MRVLPLAACVLAALLLAGCFSELKEARLERAAARMPLPEGAEETWTDSGCSGGCWSSDDAFGLRTARYPGGTNVTDLTQRLDATLRDAGWNVTESSPPRMWHEDPPRVNGGVARASDGRVSAACYVGQDADLRTSVTIECSLWGG